MRKFINDLARCETGATLIEFGMIIALLAIALSATFLALGSEIGGYFVSVEDDYTVAVR
jgi:Flp pilus assembly pilin Flp